MKKLLSIVLTVALLLSMVACIPVSAAEGEEANVDTTLGNYYKFTFGEDGDKYDYTMANNKADDTTGQLAYKGNTFYPVWTDSTDATKSEVAYKTVTLNDGSEYDVLEVKGYNDTTIVPLTKEGKPFEMIPGVNYTVNLKMFNPAAGVWKQCFVSAGTNGNKDKSKVNGVRYTTNSTTGEITAAPRTDTVAHYPYMAISGGAVSGQEFSFYAKEGTYGITAQNYPCIHSQYTGVDGNALECTHAAKSLSAYQERTVNVEIPEDVATYNEENDAYEVKSSVVDATPEDTSDDTYVIGNNYLTLSFGCSNIKSYASTNVKYPLYTNATAEEIGDGVPSVWQIVSIEVISENFKSNISYSVNGEIVKTVEGEIGTALETFIPEAPEGKYFAGWYSDEALTTLYTATAIEFGEKTVYAKFSDYGSSLKLDFEDGTYPATAVYYSALGTKWPLRGYSYHGSSYTSEIEAHLTREGFSTEFPESAVAFYSVNTWAMPGGLYFANEDGTLFVPEAGATYRVTYRYMAPVNNGSDPSINITYGLLNTMVGLNSTTDKAFAKSTLAWQTIAEPVTEWTTVTKTVTIPAAGDDHIPALGLNISGVGKVKVLAEDDETVTGYNFSPVLLDYVEVEKVPFATVTFTKLDGTTSTANFEIGTEIAYPALTASRNSDVVWSLDAEEYVAVPETITDNITVYAIESDVISFENYAQVDYIKNSLNAQVSNEKAYTGEKSLKYENVGFTYTSSQPETWETDYTKYFVIEDGEFVPVTGETAPEWQANTYLEKRQLASRENAISLWSLPGEKSYKISFKYFVPETLAADVKLIPYTNGDNIWWPTKADGKGLVEYKDSTVTIGTDTKTGEWLDGEIYLSSISIPSYDYLHILVSTAETEEKVVVYFDDFSYEEVDTATFNILVDGAIVEGNGVFKDGVFTSYGLTAPVVTVENGASIKKWYTDADCTVEATTIVAGGVYYGTIGYVEFVDGETSTKVYYNEGDAIEYPAVAGSRNFDSYWSLNAETFEAVPATFSTTVKVYLVKSSVIGFNNYPGHAYSSDTNLTVTDELEAGNKVLKVQDNDYTLLTGEKALAPASNAEGALSCWLTEGNNYYWATRYMKDENDEWVKLGDIYDEAPEFEEGKYYSNRNNHKDHAIALWQLETGKTYKVTFKYYLPEALKEAYKVTPITSDYNIWSAGKAKDYAAYLIGTDAKVGEWVDAELYFTVTADSNTYAMLYIALYQSGVEVKDIAYFDDFAVTEAKVASFVIEEGMTPEGVEAKDNVITLYFDADEEIVAPLVIDADGNPIEIWLDADGKAVTEFVSGGVYTASVAPAFIYGDCDDDGDVDTTDLAMLKLKLAGSGEVGLGGDCDGDGDVDTSDLAMLKLNLAGAGELGPQA